MWVLGESVRLFRDKSYCFHETLNDDMAANLPDVFFSSSFFFITDTDNTCFKITSLASWLGKHVSIINNSREGKWTLI